MGKKARKTRWRALPLADEYSDSEASSTTTAPGLSEVFKTHKFSNRYTYSSHSTPRRKYQYDGSKSTRSSSTTDENKMPFNEDDYTKISTPRQDVLFKKGYLNKPKNYNTQSSTGASTNSTGNSTGNGTPDYQSTDLEYESQFVFPNGFVDHNGFYYVNSYECPFMFYNVPTYYPEYSNCRSKKYSSGSLTESTSPNNEEITSQDLSCGEASNSHSDNTDHHHSLSHINNHTEHSSKYYQNGNSSTHDSASEESHVDQTRKIKKRRRRKTTSQTGEQDATENSDEEMNKKEDATPLPVLDRIKDVNVKNTEETIEPSDEISHNIITENKEITEVENAENKEHSKKLNVLPDDKTTVNIEKSELLGEEENPTTHSSIGNHQNTSNETDVTSQSELSETSSDTSNHVENSLTDNTSIVQDNEEANEEKSKDTDAQISKLETNTAENSQNDTSNESENINNSNTDSNNDFKVPKYDLKPDAEEFVPRAYRVHEIPLSPVQFVNISGNFVPLPIFPFSGQNFNPAFIPPGFPINFIPPDPKIMPNFMGFPHNGPPVNEHGELYNDHQNGPKTQMSENSCDNSNTANDQKRESEPIDNTKSSNKTIDIATVVSKLEVAAKEQKQKENISVHLSEDNNSNGFSKHPKNHKFRTNSSYRGNYNNRAQTSPQREIKYRNREMKHRLLTSTPKSESSTSNHNNDSNCTNSPSARHNHGTTHYPDSPSRQNTDTTLSSSSSYPSRQVTPTVTTNHSPLRQSEECYRKLPYKRNLSQSVTNAVSSQVASEPEVHSPNLSQKSPEKFKKVWKQSYNNTNKWKQNNTDYDMRTKLFDKKTPERRFKNEVNNRNNSEGTKMNIIKNNTSLQTIRAIDKEIKDSPKPTTNRPVDTPQESSDSPLGISNQWIAVQKRKKRKNKNVEEVGDFFDEDVDDNQNDQFESYDVNLLVDVVVPPLTEIEVNETVDENIKTEGDNSDVHDKTIEEVLTVIVETESSNMYEESIPCNDLNISEQTVNEMLPPEETDETNNLSNEVQSVPDLPKEEFVAEKITGPETPTSKDKKKKLKKSCQKLPRKKVMIKDIDLSDQYMEIKEPVKKIVAKVEKPSELIPSTSQEGCVKENCDELKTETSTESDGTFEKEISPESVNSTDQDEKKKSKKKKKKSPKVNTVSSNSDSILGSIEDTFDFLESALNGESEDKTNDEISQELDKIIQKGMMNSIEGKIKSLNIDENDEFFKSVCSKLSRKETSMGYTKIPDFTEILKTSSKTQLVSDEIHLQNKTCSKILPTSDPIETTTEDGLFLESTDIVEILEGDRNAVLPDQTEDTQNDETQIVKHEIEIGEIEQPNTLYPITKAVKEWMVRTRETTPDIELLKSPMRIYEEFGDISNSDSETELCETVENFCKELTPNSEVTLFSVEKDQSLEQDLMEYWEDDVHDNKYIDVSNEYKSDNHTEAAEEEELPPYESVYGKNEDFLNIKKIVREQNGNCARTSQTESGLPQRAAACCNIM